MSEVKRGTGDTTMLYLMRSNWFAERRPLHAVVGGRLQRCLSNTECLSGDADAPAVKSRHGYFEACESSSVVGAVELGVVLGDRAALCRH